MRILITGGAGYIGSHTCVELLDAGHEVIVVDNLCNSRAEALRRVEFISGSTIPFYQLDIRDEAAMNEVFERHAIDAVIHFAGLKAVGESTQIPLAYYDNNIHGTRVLLAAMLKHGVHSLVFSSSATVYGDPHAVPIKETFPLQATNPYGRTKLFIEEMLRDLGRAEPGMSISILRYFNPVGAHSSGLIGEDPQGIPNNLMPYISQVAVGRRESLSVFGGDYDTPDGTGVRDYIHVVDLANGHLKALERHHREPGVFTYNLGTGQGYSVLDMVEAFAKACYHPIPYQIVERRPGDIAACYADASAAQQQLGWRAQRNLQDMTNDTWRWQSKNPNGYEEE